MGLGTKVLHSGGFHWIKLGTMEALCLPTDFFSSRQTWQTLFENWESLMFSLGIVGSKWRGGRWPGWRGCTPGRGSTSCPPRTQCTGRKGLVMVMKGKRTRRKTVKIRWWCRRHNHGTCWWTRGGRRPPKKYSSALKLSLQSLCCQGEIDNHNMLCRKRFLIVNRAVFCHS